MRALCKYVFFVWTCRFTIGSAIELMVANLASQHFLADNYGIDPIGDNIHVRAGM